MKYFLDWQKVARFIHTMCTTFHRTRSRCLHILKSFTPKTTEKSILKTPEQTAHRSGCIHPVHVSIFPYFTINNNKVRIKWVTFRSAWFCSRVYLLERTLNILMFHHSVSSFRRTARNGMNTASQRHRGDLPYWGVYIRYI